MKNRHLWLLFMAVFFPDSPHLFGGFITIFTNYTPIYGVEIFQIKKVGDFTGERRLQSSCLQDHITDISFEGACMTQGCPASRCTPGSGLSADSIPENQRKHGLCLSPNSNQTRRKYLHKTVRMCDTTVCNVEPDLQFGGSGKASWGNGS